MKMTMKMTADQLLKIAGITPTTTLRTRLNESSGDSPIRKVTYKYLPRLGGVEVEVVSAGGETIELGDGSYAYVDRIDEQNVDPSVVSEVDYDKMMLVSKRMVDESDEMDGDSGQRQAVLNMGRAQHKRLFPGVPASFEIATTTIWSHDR